MPNPILAKKKDKAIAKALREALKDKVFSNEDLGKVLKAAWDGEKLDDVEFRDLKRLMRTERRINEPQRHAIELFLSMAYPLEGPFFYPGDVDKLEGSDLLGTGSCAQLVQLSQPIGKANTWREGIRVKGNDGLIIKGTAVATFEDGFYPNRSEDNHVAYYLSQDSNGVNVMDQWKDDPDKPTVSSRPMAFGNQYSNGLYRDPSNNGLALSVIMRKA